jgi:hypothetical protein
MSKIHDFERVNDIIKSCITVQQLENCYKLLAFFKKKHKKKFYSTSLEIYWKTRYYLLKN